MWPLEYIDNVIMIMSSALVTMIPVPVVFPLTEKPYFCVFLA